MRPPRERANHRSSHERRGMVPSRSFAGSGLSAVRFAIAASAAPSLRAPSRPMPPKRPSSTKAKFWSGRIARAATRSAKRATALTRKRRPSAPWPRTIRSRTSPNRSPKVSSQGIPTCRSSCSARTTSRRSSNICRAFRRNSVSASRPWRQARSRAPVSPRSQARQGRRAAAREPPNRIERLDHGLSDDR